MNWDIITTIVVPLLVGLVPAIISFYSARYQANKSLESEIKKIKEQHNFEMRKIKADLMPK